MGWTQTKVAENSKYEVSGFIFNESGNNKTQRLGSRTQNKITPSEVRVGL